MSRVATAFKAFFRCLGNADTAQAVETVLAGAAEPAAATPTVALPAPAAAPKPPTRSEALSLLAALQREARFVDFVRESITDYADEQIGAAVRDIHRDCGAVLERFFALKPVLNDAEGAAVEAPAGCDAGRYRLSGNVAGAGPWRGTLAHHGWEATKVDVPQWSGSREAARVIAPAEVEVR